MKFERVGTLKEIWPGEMRGMCISGVNIMLVRTEEGVFAYEDRCAHLGVPISCGALAGRVVTCKAHHWQYDVTTGKGVNPATASLRALTVKIENEEILVDVEVST